ncbi:hypothetical protein [Methylococcus capsulatus]|uniref:hypothetical protein n=1 Tax=Methylococcus capsulatus TaxID=414 RepID=UPI001C531DB9|nr:hypothetical protein [Methylococcus capsulatus]QXP90931.1 hypothetical protein KW114_01840 [Methylococcus capsulatus]
MMSKEEPNCKDIMNNVVKATRLIYFFSRRVRTVHEEIDKCMIGRGWRKYVSTPYPMNGLTLGGIFGSDWVFAVVRRDSYLLVDIISHNEMVNCSVKSPDETEDSADGTENLRQKHRIVIEAISVMDPGFSGVVAATSQRGKETTPCLDSFELPCLILRAYVYKGRTGSVNAWHGVLKPYFDDFGYKVGHLHSKDDDVSAYSEKYDFCNEKLRDESQICSTIDSFISEAKKELKIEV